MRNDDYDEECRLLGCSAIWIFLQHFEGIHRLHPHGEVVSNLGTSLALIRHLLLMLFLLRISFTLMMEEIFSSETSTLIRPTRNDIPEDGIHHSH
jgi:hypothetical protein